MENNIKALLCLGDAYRKKAEKDGEDVFYKLAVETFRKVIARQPQNEIAHNRVLKIASKVNILDELAVEYRNKLDAFCMEKSQSKDAIKTYKTALSIFDKRFYEALPNSVILMLFYAAYRLLLSVLKR